MFCRVNKTSLRLIASVILQTQAITCFSAVPIPMFSIQSNVAEIVSRSPGASAVFEKYQIDFCCGGGVSLASACESKGLSPATVLTEIQQSLHKKEETEAKDWLQEESVDAIIDHILDIYHVPLKPELTRLGNLMNKVATHHGPRHLELKQMQPIAVALFDELQMHLVKEETILFPYMRDIYAKWMDDSVPDPEAHCGSVANPIRVMEQEHEHAGDALKALRELSNDYTVPEDGCNSYKALYQGLDQLEHDLHRHIHLENYVLHPLAKKMEQDIQ